MACQPPAAECNGEQSRSFGFQGEAGENCALLFGLLSAFVCRLTVLSFCFKQSSWIGMRARPPCEDRRRHAGSTTHGRFHMVYIHGHVSSSTYVSGRLLKVVIAEPILSVFLFAPYPHRPCLFATPVTKDHHFPSCCWSRRYLQTVLGKKYKKTKTNKYDLDIQSNLHKLERHLFIKSLIVALPKWHFVSYSVNILCCLNTNNIRMWK